MSTNEVRHKHLESKLQIKALSETGEFEGYASAFTIDQDGERLAPGAFTRTLQHSGGKIPILFGHAINDPCGWNIEAKETDIGLWVRGRLALETETGKKAYYFLKGAQDVGASRGGGLSIGFRVIKSHVEKLDKDDPISGQKKGASILVFDEVALMEYSVVVFPCNLQAFVAAVKSQFDEATDKSKNTTNEVDGVEHQAAKINDGDGKGTNPVEQTKMMTTADTTSSPDYATNLAGKKRQRQIQANKWDAEDALYDTLSAIHGSNMSDEEKKSAIKDTYHKHADVMGDLHCAAMFPAEGEKAADFLAVLKSRELVEITGTVGGTEDAPLAITKGKGGKLSAASKAALMQVLANHQKATNTHAAVIKDMFGDDSSATVDGGGAGTEMGAMGQENPVPENKGADKSGEEKSGEDTPNPQNTQPVEVSDSDLHSFISGLRSETKSRLEVARD